MALSRQKISPMFLSQNTIKEERQNPLKSNNAQNNPRLETTLNASWENGLNIVKKNEALQLIY